MRAIHILKLASMHFTGFSAVETFCVWMLPSTLCSSGVMVAHLTPTLCFSMAWAASMVTWSSVASRWGKPKSKYRQSSWRSTRSVLAFTRIGKYTVGNDDYVSHWTMNLPTTFTNMWVTKSRLLKAEWIHNREETSKIDNETSHAKLFMMNTLKCTYG